MPNPLEQKIGELKENMPRDEESRDAALRGLDEAFQQAKNEDRGAFRKDLKGDEAFYEKAHAEFLQSLEKLRDAWKKQISQVGGVSKFEREQLAMCVDKHSKVMDARKAGWAKAGEIKDVEGIDGEDEYGYTRSMLAGYFAAASFETHKLDAEFEAAQRAYDDSEPAGWYRGWFTDQALSKEDVERISGFTEFEPMLKSYKLAPEAAGFICGYLKIAKDVIADEGQRKIYVGYVLGKLTELSRSLNKEVSERTFEKDKNKERGQYQLTVLEAVDSPMEWVANREKLEKIRSSFDVLQKSIGEISKRTDGFHFSPEILDYAAQNSDKIGLQDEFKIKEIEAKAKSELYNYLDGEIKNFWPELKDLKAKVTALQERADKLPREDVKTEVKTLLDEAEQIEADSPKFGIESNLSLDILNERYTELLAAQQKAETLDAKIAAVESNVANGELEASRAAAAAAGGTAAGAAGAAGASGSELPPLPSSQENGTESSNTQAKSPDEGKKVDHFAERFQNAEDVDNPFQGESRLRVAEKITALDLYNDEGKKIATVPGGTIVSQTDPEANGKKVFENEQDTVGKIYIKINYNGKEYWANANALSKGAGGNEVENGAKGGKGAGRESSEDFDLENAHPEYEEALKKISEEGEKLGGTDFVLQFNKQPAEFHLSKTDSGIFAITWGKAKEQEFDYKSLKEVLHAVNEGIFLQQMTELQLKNRENYKPYKEVAGQVKQLNFDPTDKLGGKFEVELDWLWAGKGSGNADLELVVQPHGIIKCRLRRDHAGIDEKTPNEETFFAANFDDLMGHRIHHVRERAQDYDSQKADATFLQKEKYFSKITDPMTFYAAEAQIGRPVSFSIQNNEVMQMYLDWGGKALKDSKVNAMVNMWVTDKGMIQYLVNFKDSAHGTSTRTVGSVTELLKNLEYLKQTQA